MKVSNQKIFAKSLLFFFFGIILTTPLKAAILSEEIMPMGTRAPSITPGMTGTAPKEFITVSTPVGSVTVNNPGFIPFSVFYTPHGSSPGFILGTIRGTVVVPESGTYQITYGITSATSAFGPRGYFAPAITSIIGSTLIPLPMATPKAILITSTAIPPWGGLAFGAYSTSASCYLAEGTELGIALFSNNPDSPPTLMILPEPNGLPSAYLTVVRLY
ncbi:MAG: hypothetical protein KR126chlam1_00173 [Chlamydiae bacterium]|nr:hypothetical protein [Chlamydiota bacterium]